MVAGGFQTLGALWPLLNPFQHPLVAWELLSHKLLRWLVPFFLLVVFITNVALTQKHRLYGLSLVVQLFFYSCAIVGNCLPSTRQKTVFYLPYYFCSVNLAAFLGFIRFLSGNQSVLWQKYTR